MKLNKIPFFLIAIIVYILILNGLFNFNTSPTTLIFSIIIIFSTIAYPLYLYLSGKNDSIKLYLSLVLSEVLLIAMQITGSIHSPFIGFLYLFIFLLGANTELYTLLSSIIIINFVLILNSKGDYSMSAATIIISFVIGYISHKKEYIIDTMKTQLNSIETHHFISPESTDLEEKANTIFSGGNDQYSYYREKTIDSLTDLIFKIFNPFTSAIFLYSERNESLSLISCKSRSKNINRNILITREANLIYWVCKYKRDILNNEFTLPSSSLEYYSKDEPIRSFTAMQIMFENKVIGVLVVDSLEENAFRWEDKEKLKLIAIQIATCIHLINDIQVKNRDSVRFSIFKDISTLLLKHLNVNEIFDLYNETLKKMLPFDSLVLIKLENDKGVFIKIFGDEYFNESEIFEYKNALIGVANKSKIPIIRNLRESEFKRIPILFPGEHIKGGMESFILYPLFAEGNNNSTIKIVAFFINKSAKFRYNEKMINDIIAPISNTFTTTIERAILYNKVKSMAIMDGLTKLYNHRYFQSNLKEIVKNASNKKKPIALIMIDIDCFKAFNDKFGHQTGDRVLKHIADIIWHVIPDNAIPARYGGEEFAIIIPDKSEEDVIHIAERLRATIENTSITLDNFLLKTTISVGIALFTDQYFTPDILIRRADTALYKSKEDGKNRITLF